MNPFHSARYWNDAQPVMPRLDSQLVEADSTDSLTPRHAFLLGEDHGVYRLGATSDFPCEHLLKGYQHGLTKPGRSANVFQRKLLALRRSAYLRRTPFSSAVNEAYLREIAVKVCPISGVELTQGTLQDTDWSVDRLVNDIGYIPGNLAVMARRVNSLKNQLSVADLLEELSSGTAPAGSSWASQMDRILPSGLTSLEAVRLVALMAPVQGLVDRLWSSSAPCAMAPGVGVGLQGGIAALHVRCARSVNDLTAYNLRASGFKPLGPAIWRQSNLLVRGIQEALRAGTHPCDLWFDPRRFNSLDAIYRAWVDHAQDAVKRPLDSDKLAEQRIEDYAQALTEFARPARPAPEERPPEDLAVTAPHGPTAGAVCEDSPCASLADELDEMGVLVRPRVEALLAAVRTDAGADYVGTQAPQPATM